MHARHALCCIASRLSVNRLPTSAPPNRRAQRGFTLIELMVVVVIIAILAVIAVPLFAQRFDERRVQQTAQRVAALYRGARSRALGRGAAILVRKTGDKFEVLEGVEGTTTSDLEANNDNCGNLPTRGCRTNDWTNVGSGTIGTARLLETVQFATGITTQTQGFGLDETFEVCFSPAGRTWLRPDTTWTPMNGA